MSRNIVVHSIDGNDHDFDRKYREIQDKEAKVKKNGEIVSESRVQEHEEQER